MEVDKSQIIKINNVSTSGASTCIVLDINIGAKSVLVCAILVDNGKSRYVDEVFFANLHSSQVLNKSERKKIKKFVEREIIDFPIKTNIEVQFTRFLKKTRSAFLAKKK